MWISVKDELPTEDKIVIIYLNKTNWGYEPDPKKVYCDVGYLQKGLTKKEREAMPDCERKKYWRGCDEGFNNECGYSWETFGTSSYFGQEVTHWMHIPELPERG